ncbi:hypothetical protein [Anaerosporobacter sp.]
MDNYYSKITQDEMNQYYQRYASIEAEDGRDKVETRRVEKDSELIIDDTTIYEIDLNCYQCLQNKMKKNNY